MTTTGQIHDDSCLWREERKGRGTKESSALSEMVLVCLFHIEAQIHKMLTCISPRWRVYIWLSHYSVYFSAFQKFFSNNRRRAMKQTKPTCAGKTHVEQQDKGRNGRGSSGKGKVPVGRKQRGSSWGGKQVPDQERPCVPN